MDANLGQQNSFSFSNLNQTHKQMIPTGANSALQNKFTADILKDSKMPTEEKLRILEGQKEFLVENSMLLEAQSLIQKINTLQFSH